MTWRGRAVLVVVGLLVGLLIGEVVFRTAVPTRDLSAVELWRAQCWRTDASGYREQPPSTWRVDSRRVLVLGDSFAAGLGICDPRDTFPWQLAQRLERHSPGAFRVNVAAKPGIDTRDELEILRSLPQQPHVLVLAYFGNDIDSAARAAGLPDPPAFAFYSDLSPFPRALVTTSRIANYAYWSLSRLADYSPILQHYQDVWARDDVVKAHLRELEGFFLPGVPLVVVVFPYMPNPPIARYTRTVSEHMRSRGAAVINVEELISDLPIPARMVAPNDLHASVEVHHRVGAALAEAITQLKKRH